MEIGVVGWGPKGEGGNHSVSPPLQLPMSLCVFYHTYLSAAAVGGVVVDERTCIILW